MSKTKYTFSNLARLAVPAKTESYLKSMAKGAFFGTALMLGLNYAVDDLLKGPESTPTLHVTERFSEVGRSWSKDGVTIEADSRGLRVTDGGTVCDFNARELTPGPWLTTVEKAANRLA